MSNPPTFTPKKPDFKVLVPVKGSGYSIWLKEGGAAWTKPNGTISIKVELLPTADWDGTLVLIPRKPPKPEPKPLPQPKLVPDFSPISRRKRRRKPGDSGGTETGSTGPSFSRSSSSSS